MELTTGQLITAVLIGLWAIVMLIGLGAEKRWGKRDNDGI